MEESVDARLVPLTVILLYFGDNPLITTLFPSPPSRLIDTPGILATASAALDSGNSCILSDDTIFFMDFAFSCLLIASIWPRACAVTTTVLPSTVVNFKLKFISFSPSPEISISLEEGSYPM